MLKQLIQQYYKKNPPHIRSKAKVFRDWNHFLAFGFGSGLSPFAPGTMGTLAAIPLYLIMVYWLPSWLYMLLTIIFLFWGIRICDRVSKELGVHDFSGIVWDEIVGFLLTMMLMPVSWEMIAVGFLAFRFFDVIKPWPINWLDRKISGGTGIMLDDVVAGIYAWLVMLLVSNYLIVIPVFPVF